MPRSPFQSVHNRPNKKIIKLWFFLKSPKFFVGASPLHLKMTWSKKFIKCTSNLSRPSNDCNAVVRFNFTLNFLIILHVTYFWSNGLLFGILSGDFQLTNCSEDVVLPRPLASGQSCAILSQPILYACVFLEQVVVLKIILQRVYCSIMSICHPW